MSRVCIQSARWWLVLLPIVTGNSRLWATPPNDDCSNATMIPPSGGNVSGTTAQATSDGSASCGSSTNSPDVWYQITPDQSGNLALSTCPSPLSIVLSPNPIVC